MTARSARAAVACLILLAAPGARAADAGAPAAPRDHVVTAYHGMLVRDPYRWLENGEDPRTIAWETAENDRTDAYLDRLPVRGEIAQRLHGLVAASSPSWHDLRLAGGQVFALVTAPPKEQPMIEILGEGPDGPTAANGRVVVDPNAIDPSGQTAIDWFVPSPDGRLVAVSLSRNGSEDGTVHVFDVATGRQTGDVIPRAQFPTAGGSLAWRADGRGFWVTRYPGDEVPEAERHFHQTVWFHTLGTPVASDRYVIGRDFPRVAEITLDNRQDPDLLMISVADGDGGAFEHIVVTPDQIPHPIDRFDDGVVAATIGPDGTTYLVSRQDAPRGKLLALAAGRYRLGNARLLIGQGDDAIAGPDEFEGAPVVVTKDAIYLRELAGGPSRVPIYDHRGRRIGALPLPGLAAVDEIDPVGHGLIYYSVGTYLEPPKFLSWDPATTISAPTSLDETSPVSFADCEVRRVFATSADGTRIPVNIIARKGTRRDGRNATLLYGYGGFGVSMSPEFLGPTVRLFLDGGGVYAIANIRGGGEYGEAWHTEGALTHKQNVFDDFHAATELLFDRGWTDRRHLAILGGSNGGLLMGAALTQWPGDYRAVVSLVGIYDMLRLELDPNGAFNVTEYGTVRNEADFRALIAYSPYQNVHAGTGYPAVYMATGTHDGRVNPMHSRKMVAALQNATTSGLPIYLSISDKSGHGIGSSLDVRIAQTSNWLAFLFNQLGMTLPAAPGAAG